MVTRKSKHKVTTFEKVAGLMTQFTGSSTAFMTALGLVIAWAVTGPMFNFSETWQLVINTGTTIITFLMVFIIQHSQNKDTVAVQLKLDALILAIDGASNKLVDAENLCEEDLKVLKEHYTHLTTILHSNKSNKKKSSTHKK